MITVFSVAVIVACSSDATDPNISTELPDPGDTGPTKPSDPEESEKPEESNFSLDTYNLLYVPFR